MSRSNDFEKEIDKSFVSIRKKCGTWFDWLNPPMVCTGYRGKCPTFMPNGSSMFDIIGWQSFKTYTEPRAIGIELKQNGPFKSHMPLMKPKAKGSGIKYHQLEALAALHRDGHIAGLLWNNAGQIGYLGGVELSEYFFNFSVSIRAEELGAKPERGTRSIPWNVMGIVKGDEIDSWYFEGFAKSAIEGEIE